MSTTLDTIEQRLSENINDWLEVTVTTAIAASTSVVSTSLRAYDGGSDDFFNGWWVYITDYANLGVERQVSDYATATGTITVLGANLTTDNANLATVQVSRYPRTIKVKAIQRAIEEVYPSVHKTMDDMTLITGNWLPNSHFEDWASTSYPDKYAVSNATAAEDTTAGQFRGGTSSAKVTASAADGYMYITSNTYPKLLSLMGQTVNFKCWVYSEVADDAFLTIYTASNDGTTTQTLNSTTTCAAAKWTLLELETQALNDDLHEIQFRFRVHTNVKYVVFDDARVTGSTITEYYLPTLISAGNINQVFLQTTGTSDDACDDLNPSMWYREYNYDVRHNDTSNAYLYLPYQTNNYRIRLRGTMPLEAVSSATDTISLNAGGRLDMLIAYASYYLFKTHSRPVSSDDVSRLKYESSDYYGEYERLRRKHGMMGMSGTLKVG